ncbi:SDR family oxidoreductase [Aquamicrobium terrae]
MCWRRAMWKRTVSANGTISDARQENVGVEDIIARTLETIPLRRYGTPEGYARLAAFLLSEENDYVSGQQVLYDGGLVVAN